MAQGGIAASVAVTAGANVVGGGVERALDSSVETQAFDAEAATFDLAVGAVAGVGGVAAEGIASKSLPTIERQVAASQARARGGGTGSFGASRSVQGHQRKAQATATRARVLSNVTGAKITGVVGPLVKSGVTPNEEKE